MKVDHILEGNIGENLDNLGFGDDFRYNTKGVSHERKN